MTDKNNKENGQNKPCSKCGKYNKIVVSGKWLCDTCYRKDKIGENPLKKCECKNPNCKEMIPTYSVKGKVNRFATGHHIFGENNPRWNDGTYTDPDGYLHVKAPKDHPYKDVRGYIWLHRAVMERHLSKLQGKPVYLGPEIIVHHKNENKKDNRIENLEMMTKQKHGEHHNTYTDITTRKCHLCGKTRSFHWYFYKEGYICQVCYIMLKRKGKI
jgi:hypothetical protein